MDHFASYRFFDVEELRQAGRVTYKYYIRNRASGEDLATISWYGAWRQFCFFPEIGTVWSDGCLREVRHCLGLIEAKRKRAKEVPVDDRL